MSSLGFQEMCGTKVVPCLELLKPGREEKTGQCTNRQDRLRAKARLHTLLKRWQPWAGRI